MDKKQGLIILGIIIAIAIVILPKLGLFAIVPPSGYSQIDTVIIDRLAPYNSKIVTPSDTGYTSVDPEKYWYSPHTHCVIILQNFNAATCLSGGYDSLLDFRIITDEDSFWSNENSKSFINSVVNRCCLLETDIYVQETATTCSALGYATCGSSLVGVTKCGSTNSLEKCTLISNVYCWKEISTCPGQICKDGACTDPGTSCSNPTGTDGQQQCFDGSLTGYDKYSFKQCDNGVWTNIATCPFGQICNFGTVSNDVCYQSVCNNNGICDSGEDCDNCILDCRGTCTPTCTDSDAQNIAIKGEIFGRYVSGQAFFEDDTCSSSTIVTEQICSGTAPSTISLTCSSGQTCCDGACKTDCVTNISIKTAYDINELKNLPSYSLKEAVCSLDSDCPTNSSCNIISNLIDNNKLTEAQMEVTRIDFCDDYSWWEKIIGLLSDEKYIRTCQALTGKDNYFQTSYGFCVTGEPTGWCKFAEKFAFIGFMDKKCTEGSIIIVIIGFFALFLFSRMMFYVRLEYEK